VCVCMENRSSLACLVLEPSALCENSFLIVSGTRGQIVYNISVCVCVCERDSFIHGVLSEPTVITVVEGNMEVWRII